MNGMRHSRGVAALARLVLLRSLLPVSVPLRHPPDRVHVAQRRRLAEGLLERAARDRGLALRVLREPPEVPAADVEAGPRPSSSAARAARRAAASSSFERNPTRYVGQAATSLFANGSCAAAAATSSIVRTNVATSWPSARSSAAAIFPSRPFTPFEEKTTFPLAMKLSTSEKPIAVKMLLQRVHLHDAVAADVQGAEEGDETRHRILLQSGEGGVARIARSPAEDRPARDGARARSRPRGGPTPRASRRGRGTPRAG